MFASEDLDGSIAFDYDVMIDVVQLFTCFRLRWRWCHFPEEPARWKLWGEPSTFLCSLRPPGRQVSLNSDSDNNAERHFVFICNLVDTNDSGFLAR